MDLVTLFNSGIGIVSLVIITLTYLRTRRMRPDQLEAQLVRRLNGPFYLADATIDVRDVRISMAESLFGRMQNLVKRYPLGWVMVEVALSGPRVTHDRPWNENAFVELCEREEVNPSFFVKPKDASPSPTDEFVVEIRFETTNPDTITYFIRNLVGAVAGEHLPAPEGEKAIA